MSKKETIEEREMKRELKMKTHSSSRRLRFPKDSGIVPERLLSFMDLLGWKEEGVSVIHPFRWREESERREEVKQGEKTRKV